MAPTGGFTQFAPVMRLQRGEVWFSMAGRFASNATRSKFCVPLLNSGLENKTALGWYFLSCPGLSKDPGHTSWYDSPSKSTSVAKQPAILIRDEADAEKHPWSSPSRPPGSFTP